MTSLAENPRVVQESVDSTIQRLETFVSRMERRYECESSFAAQAVACGHMKDTAEVSRWLISYRTLQRLRTTNGRATGTRTRITA